VASRVFSETYWIRRFSPPKIFLDLLFLFGVFLVSPTSNQPPAPVAGPLWPRSLGFSAPSPLNCLTYAYVRWFLMLALAPPAIDRSGPLLPDSIFLPNLPPDPRFTPFYRVGVAFLARSLCTFFGVFVWLSFLHCYTFFGESFPFLVAELAFLLLNRNSPRLCETTFLLPLVSGFFSPSWKFLFFLADHLS